MNLQDSARGVARRYVHADLKPLQAEYEQACQYAKHKETLAIFIRNQHYKYVLLHTLLQHERKLCFLFPNAGYFDQNERQLQ